jgi:dihydrolipoamide dehydrogenase
MVSSYSDEGQLPWLADNGISLLRGVGQLTGERTVQVTSAAATTTTLTARHAIVLATGTSAAMPPIPGLRDAQPWDNRTITAAKDLPPRLLVLGGGAIGAEMAQTFARLGSQVVVVEGAPRLLAREEPFAGAQVREALEAEGLDVVTGVNLAAVERAGPDGPVTATLSNGRTVEADEILVAVGRRPRTMDLGLETVGLTPGRPVEVDDKLRAVAVPGGWLYAVGDVNGRAQLTHMGKYQARIAGDVILGKPARDQASADCVPRVTFTDPQVAAVGLTEEQARERYPHVRLVSCDVGSVAGSYVLGDGIGGTAALVVDEDRRMLVGATFTGPAIQELLHSATVAIAGHVTVEDLWHAVPSFPTVSEVWLRLLETYGL